MDDPKIRLGCLELATQINKPSGDYSVESVVKIATLLYTFTQASMLSESPTSIADKPKQKLKGNKRLDILS